MRQNGNNIIKRLSIATPSTWLLLFFVVPFLIILTYSFFQRGSYGEIIYELSFSNYRELLDPIYITAFSRTLIAGIFTSLVTLAIAYPISFYIAQRANKRIRELLLVAVMLPLWTSYLARTYSWMIILGENGFVNKFLLSVGILQEPIEVLFTPLAIIIGLIYNYLPFMILTLYVSLEKIDPKIIKSSRDLGANRFQAFWHVVLPLSKTGIVNGSILVFVFGIADYVIPNILGGSKFLLLSNVIANQFIVARNIPLGSALTVVFTTLVFVLVLLQSNLTKKRGS